MSKNESERVAAALICHEASEVFLELGRLCVDRNRSAQYLRRHFQRLGIDRTALNVPVFKGERQNEQSRNVIDLVNVVDDGSDHYWLRNYAGLEVLRGGKPGNCPRRPTKPNTKG